MRIRQNTRIEKWHELRDRAQALIAVLRRETGARLLRRSAEAKIVCAERAILSSNDSDTAVEGFVNWLPEARGAIEKARSAEREVAIDVAVAYHLFMQAKGGPAGAGERGEELSSQ
ncbi:hypothetical protein [Asaia platycodi]|uniref:hypothetical protein n=1 Tax=Asaia platycodi TaxID=610243 RepID=UPI00047153AC|nr:hypothetical protein [Asaia platycodi]